MQYALCKEFYLLNTCTCFFIKNSVAMATNGYVAEAMYMSAEKPLTELRNRLLCTFWNITCIIWYDYRQSDFLMSRTHYSIIFPQRGGFIFGSFDYQDDKKWADFMKILEKRRQGLLPATSDSILEVKRLTLAYFEMYLWRWGRLLMWAKTAQSIPVISHQKLKSCLVLLL